MRTKDKPDDFYEGDWNEKTCRYTRCKIPTFYTTNDRAEDCCDKHRYKYNQEKNKIRNEAFRMFNKKFNTNAKGIQTLHSKGIFYPSNRDLEIVDFDLNIKNVVKKEGDLFRYYYLDYILEINGKDGTKKILKIKNNGL